MKEINCEDIIKANVKEISRKVLYESKVKELVIKNIWDNNGRKIAWENEKGNKKETIKNVDVKVERIFKNWFGNEVENDVLYLDGKEYNALDIYKVSGNSSKLVITACVGQG